MPEGILQRFTLYIVYTLNDLVIHGVTAKYGWYKNTVTGIVVF